MLLLRMYDLGGKKDILAISQKIIVKQNPNPKILAVRAKLKI